MTQSPTPPTEGPGPMPTPGAQRTVDLPASGTEQVGEYRLLSILGTGGMGVVYKAFDLKLGRLVALKMLQVGIAPDPGELIRFRGEAEALGSLQHPNIVQIYDFGMHEEKPYLVMEFVTGGGLDAKLGGQPQPPRRAAELIETLARAIQAAHDQNIIHRDLKPANVLLAPDGTPKITDFGLAKRLEAGPGLTQTGEVMGTPSYMAPEQALGKKDVGKPADIYALGAILYECLTGRPPFRGATLPETLEQVCEDDPAPPSRLVPRLPRDISTISLKCLHKAPGRRYASAQELADDLRNYLDGHAIQARPTSVFERLWRVVTRRPLQAGLMALGGLLVATLVLLLLGWRERNRELAARREQDEQRKRFDEEKQRRDEQHRKEVEDLRRYYQTEYVSSLAALDGILQLTLDGELKNVPRLEPLHRHLKDFYEKLIERQGKTQYAEPERLAKYMKELGTVLREWGEFNKAIVVLTNANRLCVKAGGTHPDSGALQHHRAEILLQRGRALQQAGGLAKAEADFSEGRKVIQALQAARKADAEHDRTEGELLHWHAVLLADGDPKRWKEALKLYDEAQAQFEKLARRPGATQDDRRNLARVHGYRGDLEMDLGLRPQADSSYWRSHKIRADLAKGGDDESLFQLARSWTNLGNFQVRGGALASSRFFYDKALEIRQKLVEKNPNMGEYRSDLGQIYRTLAEVSLLTSHPGSVDAEVEALLADSVKCYEELQRRDRHAVDPLSGLGTCYALRARLRLLQGKPEDAGADLRTAEDCLRRALRKRSVSYADRYHLAAVEAMQAELAGGAKRRPEMEGEALDELRGAYKDGFRRLRAEEIFQDRAFQALKGRDDFKQLVTAGPLFDAGKK